MARSKSVSLLLVFFLSCQCFAQGTIFEVSSEPVMANSKGEVVPISKADNFAGFSDSLSTPHQLLATTGSVRHQIQEFYGHCPGLVTPLETLRKRADFEVLFQSDERKALNKLLDSAISERKKLCDENESKSPDQYESIVRNNRLMQRIFDQELVADAKLSDLISEIVPPDSLGKYVTAMGSDFELQILSSRLFHDVTHQQESRFKERLSNSQAYCKWAVARQFSSDKDRESNTETELKLLTRIYEDLTIDEFLKLKMLFGKSKVGEDFKSYLSRTQKIDSSMFVTAIRNSK